MLKFELIVILQDSTMTRPAKISSGSLDGVSNGDDLLISSRPMATEARPNPVILEDDNEGSMSREASGK